MTAIAIDPAVTRAPLTPITAAGRVLILAGSIFGAANLFQWAVMDGRLLHPAFLSLSWPVAVATFLIALRRLRAGGGEGARRVMRWSRLFILSQIAAALSLAALSAVRGDWSLMLWMSPVGLSLYAIAWGVGALRSGQGWMNGVAFGATVAAAGITQLLGTPLQYLAYAASLLAFVLIPGLYLAAFRRG